MGDTWEPKPGEIVAVRTADDRWVRKVVVGAGGLDFPCWNVSDEGGDIRDWMPWPIEDVRPLDEHPNATSRQRKGQ